jgi:hypothetical protein
VSGSSGIPTMQQPLAGRGIWGKKSPIGGAAQRERSLTGGHPENPGPLGRRTERGSWSRPAFASRAGPADGFGTRSRKEFFIFPKHFPFNTEVELNPGKYLGSS